MTAEKPECMRVAKQFGQKYWDGDRKYGYGGYHDDGRWKSVAEAMVKYYGLKSDSTALDIGCGKGFLLAEIAKNIGFCRGCDIDPSGYLLDQITEEFDYKRWDAVKLGSKDSFFNLTYSINVFHNLCYKDLKQAIREMVRVSKDRMYICVESYRNEEELCNLQCWALTCQSFYSPDDWLQIYEDNGYRGDYEFIYFQ